MSRRVKRHFPGESWDEYYRRYQSTLASAYLIPILGKWGVSLEGKRVLEVGSGDGGCSAAFFKVGCRVTSMEIDERLVRIAREFNQRDGLDIRVYCGDVCDAHGEALEEGPFDIILLRDVIEHLPQPKVALENLKVRLSEEGVLFIVFPPYYSPYGAHQQILPKKKLAFIPYNRLPYIQLLPDWLFLWLVGGGGAQHSEVTRLRGIRLTLRKFERDALESGLRIRRRKLYLSRPTFALRYGIPVMGASVLGGLPFLNEVAVAAAYYLLENEKRA